ncbi:uncharacterized protein LOC123505752 [Portunus trituberculatus]|uniref:uncharacterized protein LOC123505752 n=1 Tax=Portunus trituberculatus TaxID=210409 RepID=UPI001E1D19DC|nr:uncharacterized protein LOC123505752 [Portunus trituberculatus]
MLIRRRVDVIRQLVTELELVMSVTLVRSSENRADALTRVPVEWVRGDKDGSAVSVAAVAAASAASSRDSSVASVADVHIRAGHPGVRRTLFFARRDISRAVTRAEARATVRQCEMLPTTRTSVAPTCPLSTAGRLGSLCGGTYVVQMRTPSSVTWNKSSASEERRRNCSVTTTLFRGRRFAAFAARWGVSLRFRGAYAPSGNGIVERNNRTVKVIAARKGCSVAEAVHLYNVTPRDGETVASAPVSGIYRYRVRDCVRHDQVQHAVHTSPDVARKNYTVDDAVWVRRRGERCTSASQPGVVTRVNSPQVVEVDGVPRHVRDLRHRSSLSVNEAGTPDEPGVEDEPPLHVDAQSQLLQPQVAEPPPEAPREAVLRRSTRERHPPQRYCCDPGDQGGV